MEEPEYLYHYTNFKGLKGIIDSKKLRFSDYRALTDRSEFSYSKALLCKVINDELPDQFKLMTLKTREKLSERIWEIFIENKNPIAYLFCVCEHKESDWENGLLSMWRSYGQKGGYSLVFYKTKLIKYLREQAEHCLEDLLLDEKVEYPKTKKDLSNCLKKHLIIFRKAAKEKIIPKGINPSSDFNITKDEFGSILHLVTLIKHPGFHEENEYRFCLFARPEERPPENEKHFAFKPQIEELGSSIVSYIERPIDIDNLVKEIIIGPQRDMETKRRFLEDYLKSQGLSHIPVRESKIPYLPR